MVDATVTNDPVSIQLSGTSTTVPSNETWVVNVGVHGGNNQSRLDINSKQGTTASPDRTKPHPPQFKMVFDGGDQIAEGGGGLVSIQGFVVDS
jgi:hypothetical protein